MNYDTAISFAEDLLKSFRLTLHYIDGSRGFDSSSSADILLVKLLNIPPEPHYILEELNAHCHPNTIYQIDSSLLCNYFLLRLPGNEKNPTFIYAGPYTPCLVTQKHLIEIVDKHLIHADNIPALKQFYQNLPQISDENVLLSIFYTLGKHLWGGIDSFSVKKMKNTLTFDLNMIPFKESSDNTDNLLLNMQMIEQRYALEGQLLQSVSAGQAHKAEMIMAALAHNQYEQRSANTLRSRKNYLIVLNTVLRIAATNGTVHPLYVDQISSQFAHKIETLTSENATDLLMKEMVRKYCLLVKNHSMKGYSLLIQKVLSNIDHDLTADLSLKAQAELLNVNPSYLSALFRKETGMTLTDYVNHKRVDHAIFLLNSTNMQIQMIAQYCGIPGVNYFTKTFRKIVGKTPSEYRKSILNLV